LAVLLPFSWGRDMVGPIRRDPYGQREAGKPVGRGETWRPRLELDRKIIGVSPAPPRELLIRT
jgi:hypothetical protein